MRLKIIATLLCCAAFSSLAEDKPNIPGGYKLVYEQDFEKPNAPEDFEFTDAKAWEIRVGNTKVEKGKSLELKQQSKYSPAVRSPVNIALLKGKEFGDFVLEADMLQTGREYGHRDMCIFFGFQSPTEFYYTHIASAADANAHNVFIVDQKPRANFAKQTTTGVNWGLEVWHKIRLERNAQNGEIRVYFDDMTKPIMIAESKKFEKGAIGFGSFDDTGKIDNIKIWAPKMEKTDKQFFAKEEKK